MLTKSQQKAIVNNFCRGRQYEHLEGQEGRQFSATETNFEKMPAGGGARCWILNSPKLAHLRFHFWLINGVKSGEVVKVGIVLPILVLLKIILSATKTKPKTMPTGGGAHGLIQNRPKSSCLCFHCQMINRGKGGEVQSKWLLFFHYNLFKN